MPSPATLNPQTAKTVSPGSPFEPVPLEKYQEEKAQRAKQRDDKRPEMMRCLDPEYAASVEARKPIYEYEITCEVMGLDKETGQRKHKTLTGRVRGQNENQAWKRFCDQRKTWPSPIMRTITKVKAA